MEMTETQDHLNCGNLIVRTILLGNLVKDLRSRVQCIKESLYKFYKMAKAGEEKGTETSRSRLKDFGENLLEKS
jgi:hypothetical protein